MICQRHGSLSCVRSCVRWAILWPEDNSSIRPKCSLVPKSTSPDASCGMYVPENTGFQPCVKIKPLREHREAFISLCYNWPRRHRPTRGDWKSLAQFRLEIFQGSLLLVSTNLDIGLVEEAYRNYLLGSCTSNVFDATCEHPFGVRFHKSIGIGQSSTRCYLVWWLRKGIWRYLVRYCLNEELGQWLMTRHCPSSRAEYSKYDPKIYRLLVTISFVTASCVTHLRVCSTFIV